MSVDRAPVATEASFAELQRARLEYLFDAARLVAKSWPLMRPDETCVLLVERERQWEVNCDVAVRGFVATREKFHGRPLFTHAGDAFESAGQRRSTRELLASTPAAAQVPEVPNALPGLPTEHAFLLLGSLEALAAYHPSFPRATTEAWISVAMHEFVHTHQLRHPSFAPYRARLHTPAFDPAPLIALFTQDDAYRVAVLHEYQTLTAAARREPRRDDALAALRAWHAQYRKRRALLAARPQGASLIERDRVFTYLEGVARYVESDFLDRADQHPKRIIPDDPRFHAYADFLGRGYAASPNRQLDDQYYYAIGYHLCVLLQRADPEWRDHVQAQPGLLLGYVDALLNN
jgi:hypothetical protein